MRALVLAAIAGLASSSTARAEPRLEASGFVGVDWFGKHSELGNAWAPEQVPGTSPLLGARVTWLALPDLAPELQLAVEGEIGIAPAFTGDSTRDGRMSYFAPVIEWHAHALLRLDRWARVAPHLVLGAGGETVASASPFMAKETDPIEYWGIGATVPAFAGWHVRLDARHGIMPAREGGVTSTFEVSFGIGTTFGLSMTRAPRRPVEPPALPVVDDTDSDGDGIPDRLDRCPTERETVNGVADDDGCPEADPDSDGILGDADKCPAQAEDFDGFEDSDGCPEPDNDLDGIDDKRDLCPNEPETLNGFEDDDGCPDELPAEVTAALATLVKFEPNRARVTEAAGAALAPLLALLQTQPTLRLAITGHPEHPERPDSTSEDLARRRAEAVKWYLVDQGITGDRLTTRVESAQAPSVTFELAIR
ncbi:MAG TPA: OmpA family protein [Kofleriaceae bacterium]|nr:OmpA family protein [Kofleriaceae bacterium]